MAGQETLLKKNWLNIKKIVKNPFKQRKKLETILKKIEDVNFMSKKADTVYEVIIAFL